MPDRSKNDHTRNGVECNEFDALLTDAIDGILGATELERFQVHARVCRTCGPLLADAEAGRNWLKGLTEVEPPASLVASILASTTGVDTQRLRVPVRVAQPHASVQVSWLARVQASLSGYIEPIWETVRQPRFAMSFGMAFFALSVSLTVLGVKPDDIRQVSLRPSAIRHTYYNTQARVVRYYDNVRWVYEMQAAVRRIKRDVAPAEPGIRESRPAKTKDDKNDTTQQPEQNRERNYSQTESQVILASAPMGLSVRDLPVVSVTTYRRFV
jgi:Putative zinc-finger